METHSPGGGAATIDGVGTATGGGEAVMDIDPSLAGPSQRGQSGLPTGAPASGAADCAVLAPDSGQRHNFKGVSFSNQRKWRAKMTIGGKKHHIGQAYVTAQAAARAFDRAQIAVHGRAAAKTNYPLEAYPDEDQLSGAELDVFLVALRMDTNPAGVAGVPHLELPVPGATAWDRVKRQRKAQMAPPRCGICRSCRQPWLHQPCEYVMAELAKRAAKRELREATQASQQASQPTQSQEQEDGTTQGTSAEGMSQYLQPTQPLQGPAAAGLPGSQAEPRTGGGALQRKPAPGRRERKPLVDSKDMQRREAEVYQAQEGVRQLEATATGRDTCHAFLGPDLRPSLLPEPMPHADMLRRIAQAADAGQTYQLRPLEDAPSKLGCRTCKSVRHGSKDCPVLRAAEQPAAPADPDPLLRTKPKAEPCPWLDNLTPARQEVLLAMQELASAAAREHDLHRGVGTFPPEALLACGLLVEEVMRPAAPPAPSMH